jgi:hypothetical protein
LQGIKLFLFGAQIRPGCGPITFSLRELDKQMPETSTTLEELVNVIHPAIAARGFYILMDERLKHICGDGYAEDTSSNRDLIAAFAKKHQLAWRRTEGMVIFMPSPPKKQSQSLTHRWNKFELHPIRPDEALGRPTRIAWPDDGLWLEVRKTDAPIGKKGETPALSFGNLCDFGPLITGGDRLRANDLQFLVANEAFALLFDLLLHRLN